MKKFIKYGIIAGGALILAGAGITTASLLLGADMGDLNGHIRKRLHHLDELDGIVEREVDLEEYLVRVDQLPAQEGWETARAEEQDPAAGPSSEPFTGGDPWQSSGTDGGFEAGYPKVTDLKIRQQGGSVEIFRMEEISDLIIKSANGSIESSSYWEHGVETTLALRAGEGEEYQIFIPDTWILDEFEAEVLDGTLDGNGVRVLEAELSVTEGSAAFTQEDGRKADLECVGSGSISWAMETERYMEIDAECRNGSIALSFPETIDPGALGYDIECENGTVVFPDFTVDGNQKKRGSGKLSFLDLEVIGGTISVQNTEMP